MKKLDLGQTITILANLGVIAGIVFLAIEIQQNNQLLRAEAIGTALETRLVRQEIILANDSLVTAHAKNNRGEPLTDEDRIRLNAANYRNMLGRQKDYFLYQEGILTEELFRANFPIMKVSLSDSDATYSGRDFWEARKMVSATPAFRDFVEACILSECETIPR